MIVETAAIIADEAAMYWNSASRFKGEAYFYPSVASLDYFARFLRMEVIDCAFLEWGSIDGLLIARVALACRAIQDVTSDPDDHFIKGTFHTELDIREHLDWQRCLSTSPPVAYEAPARRILRHQSMPLRALRRATRNLGLKNLSNRIDNAIAYRPATYWLRRDCKSLDLVRFCKQAKQQLVSDRDTELWLSDMA
jgi:hypothetical protein